MLTYAFSVVGKFQGIFARATSNKYKSFVYKVIA